MAAVSFKHSRRLLRSHTSALQEDHVVYDDLHRLKYIGSEAKATEELPPAL